MTDQNGSKKWLYAVRLIMILMGIIQMGLIGWAKFITTEVIQSKSESAMRASELKQIREDINYIRGRLDEVWRKK